MTQIFDPFQRLFDDRSASTAPVHLADRFTPRPVYPPRPVSNTKPEQMTNANRVRTVRQ